MQPGVVAIGDDTPRPIANVGEVPLSHVGQKGKLMNMLHVPTITKNLVLVGQIVDQGMEVRFTHLGCFIEEEGRVIAQGCKEKEEVGREGREMHLGWILGRAEGL